MRWSLVNEKSYEPFLIFFLFDGDTMSIRTPMSSEISHYRYLLIDLDRSAELFVVLTCFYSCLVRSICIVKPEESSSIDLPLSSELMKLFSNSFLLTNLLHTISSM